MAFKNQPFYQFVTQMKNKHFDTSVKRRKFTKAERDDIYKTNKESKCAKSN